MGINPPTGDTKTHVGKNVEIGDKNAGSRGDLGYDSRFDSRGFCFENLYFLTNMVLKREKVRFGFDSRFGCRNGTFYCIFGGQKGRESKSLSRRLNNII